MRRINSTVLLLLAAFLIGSGLENPLEAARQKTAQESKSAPAATPAQPAAKAQQSKKPKGETGEAGAQTCTGDEIPLGAITGADAMGLARALNSFFTEFTVTASSNKDKSASSLCVASREKNKKLGECTKDKTSSENRCALNAIAAVADNDGFIGAGLNASFVIPLKSLPAAEIAQSLPYPVPDIELRDPYGKYLMLVPLAGATSGDSGKNGGLAKQAASIKHDLELMDNLYGSAVESCKTAQEMRAALEASDGSAPNSEDFRMAERLSEEWLARHTVRFSFLDPRDVALALSGVSKDWTVQVRSFGSAVTILPREKGQVPIRNYGAYVAADAIERDTIFRRRATEAKASAQASSQGSGGESKTGAPSNTFMTHTSTTTSQPAQAGKTPGPPVTTVVDTVTTTSQAAPPPGSATPSDTGQPAPGMTSGNDTSPNTPTSVPANAKPGGTTTQTSGQNKGGGGANPSAKVTPPQQPMRFDTVVRLYHLRQAGKIAGAINAASPDGKPLVQALDDNGNDDLLLILPSPAGGADQSTPIRRAIALLDLPRPQLSLQVWSYQISAQETSNDPERRDGPRNVQATFEKLRTEVNDANRLMTEKLQKGFGEILDEADAARTRTVSIFDPTLEAYLTGRYEQCVLKDSYCLGFQDALAVPQGTKRAVNASLSRMLLYLISVSDGEAANLAAKVIAAMQTDGCPADLTKLGMTDDVPLCFPNFSDQLTVALGPRNLHILRAALLDFLFEYKWTFVYPNDFVPYDLQRTAHLLDSLLGPIIDAFNEDLDNYVLCRLDQLARQATQEVEGGTDYQKAGLSTQGMVQVATLSGSKASVDAQVKNYFDITPPLSLNDILNTGNQQNLASNLKNVLEPKEILALQALANVGSAPRIQAELTKEAKLAITPTTLDTASSAQLDVDFDVSEPSPPSTVNQASAQKDLLDRVADHHVTTHVRVESLRLFQVSAFTMELTHPQRPVPLPVLGWGWQAIFGTTPGLNKVFMIPRSPRTVDNRSVAIVRAVVVPTAMDIGLGLPFIADRVYDPVSEATDPMFSVAQSGGKLRPFHKALMSCILMGRSDCLDPISGDRVRLSSMHEDLRDSTAP